jgi:hyperosmotically inducible protein
MPKNGFIMPGHPNGRASPSQETTFCGINPGIAMKEFFIGLIVGAVLSLATAWYFVYGRQQPGIRHAQDTTAAALQQAADSAEAKFKAWHLMPDDIKDELTRTGKVVRRSATDWGDARITAAIKAKFVTDSDLSAWGINVNTTAGLVTLSGTVPTYKHIARAMAHALDTPGVRDVKSTLQVKK